jgi:hypothetical protein
MGQQLLLAELPAHLAPACSAECEQFAAVALDITQLLSCRQAGSKVAHTKISCCEIPNALTDSGKRATLPDSRHFGPIDFSESDRSKNNRIFSPRVGAGPRHFHR